MRDLVSPEPWQRSLERSRHRRAITPEARRRQSRRRRASTALTTLMVAGPAGQVLAATSPAPDPRIAAASPATRAIDRTDVGLLFRLGSTGAAVQEIQQRLGVDADGIFGPLTERAVRDYQAANELLVDGVVGPATWTRLFGLEDAAMSAGAAGGDVAVIVRPRSAATQAPSRTTSADRTAPATLPVGGGDAPSEAGGEGTGDCGGLQLAAPIKGIVTSNFGPRGGRNHDGMDIAAPTGTPVRAAECGVVSQRGAQSGYGNMVCVKHSSRFETCYAHLSRFAVSGGEQVRKGQLIGYVGCTGSCTGPHVHFETRVDGRAQDPRPYLRGSAVPGTPTVRSAERRRAGGPETTTAARGETRDSGSAPGATDGGGAQAPAPGTSASAEQAPAEAPATPAEPAPQPAYAEPAPVAAEAEPVAAEPVVPVAPDPVVPVEAEPVAVEPVAPVPVEPVAVEPPVVVPEPVAPEAVPTPAPVETGIEPAPEESMPPAP